MRRSLQRLSGANKTVWTSPYTVEIPSVSLPKFLSLHKPSASEKPAIIDAATKRVVTYKELPHAVSAAVAGLRKAGVKRGDVVALHAPNSAEYILAFQGILGAGAQATTTNPVYSAEEIGRQCVDSRASLMITTPELLPSVKAALSGTSTGVRSVLVIGQDSAAFLSPQAAAGQSKLVELEDVPGDAIAALPYSSGTTGMPKGVMLTHSNLVANVAQMLGVPQSNIGFGSKDVMIGVLPLFHIYGMQLQMGAVLKAGGTVVTLPKFDPVQFLEAITKYKVTWAPLVPPLISFMLRHPLASSPNFNLTSLRSVLNGAAPLDAGSQEALSKKFNIDCRQGYGMTEMSPVSHIDPEANESRPQRACYGSIGVPIANTSVQVVDPVTGQAIPLSQQGPHRTGELWVKGPQVMMGYLNNPKSTAESLTTDGWLKTGDIVYMREDGYTFVVDRLKELIKVKGLQVAPAELEGVLLQHPAVLDAGVVGRADDKSGEVPVAFVVRKRDALAAQDPSKAALIPTCTAEDLQAHVAKHVAPYKHIAHVYFVDAIPKTASGKIMRKVLKTKL